MQYSHLASAALAAASYCGIAWGQPADYPSKPVRVIVAAASGSGADLAARLFTQKLNENLKNQFFVDNRPGGGDTIAIGMTAKAPPDGYTLMVTTPSLSIAPTMNENFHVDPVKDFSPVTLLTKAPHLLAVHPALPVKSVKELIALAHAKPGALDLGITNGGISHLETAHFAAVTKIKITMVPYTQVGQMLTDAAGGMIQGYFLPIQIILPMVRSGRMRAIAVSTAERTPVLPDLPTVSESGVTGFDVSVWYGVIGPTGMPSAMVNRLNGELVKALKSPDVAKRMADDGTIAVGSSPEQFGQLIASEYARWRTVIKDLNLRAE